MNRQMRYPAFILPLVLIACAKEQKPAAPQQSPPVATLPAPPQPAAALVEDSWPDAALTPGDWVYRRDDRGSLALFGTPRADARFMLRCDARARRIYLSRQGTLAEGDSAVMTLRATSGVKSFTVRNTGDTPPYVAVALAANERQLDAIAYSRGRFLVSIKGSNDLVIPSWPEIARVIEDCRG